MAKNSAAKIAANRRYTEKAYKRVSVYIKVEDVERLNDAAKGQSINGFINDAIMEKINGKSPPEIVPDLELYARQVGQTAEEYTAQAIRERMQRQDQEAEELEHIPFID